MSLEPPSLTRTERNLWNAIVSEALAYLKYNAYAHKALEEGYPEVAQIFQEVAGAETIHGLNHLRVAGEVGPTLDNLRNVAVSESKEFSYVYPRMISDALQEGRQDAADSFALALERERHHLEVFSRALELLEQRQAQLGIGLPDANPAIPAAGTTGAGTTLVADPGLDQGAEAHTTPIAPTPTPTPAPAPTASPAASPTPTASPALPAATAGSTPSTPDGAAGTARSAGTSGAAGAGRLAGSVSRPGSGLDLDTYVAATMEVDRERFRVANLGRLREVVFGAQDGILSTVALVTSVAVAIGSSSTVLLAGLAAALAGMISMASGAYLGSRAEQDVQRAEILREARELEENPAEELAELVVIFQREGKTYEEANALADEISQDRDLWLRTLVEKELGISPNETTNPIKDALVMGTSFVVASMVPIAPYLFLESRPAIGISVAGSLLGLFILGMGKGRMVGKSPILQGLEILGIGAVSAGIGFALGDVIPRLIP